MGHLQIIFAGVCTHFTALRAIRSDLPPHRVVLPPCSDFRFGLLEAPLPDGSGLMQYYLHPHFVTLQQYQTPSERCRVDVPDFTSDCTLASPAKIEVLNATDDADNQLSRGDWFDDPRYSLANYVPNYTMSQETVIGGRAMCYFDLTHGRVTSPPPSATSDRAAYVVADIETTGRPRLRFTHLTDAGGRPQSQDIPLAFDDVTLLIANLEVMPIDSDTDTPFDFIQHYATSAHGIPQVVNRALPGMPLFTSGELTKDVTEIATAMQTFANNVLLRTQRARPDFADIQTQTVTNNVLLRTQRVGPDFAEIQRIDPATLNPSCSDSHYP